MTLLESDRILKCAHRMRLNTYCQTKQDCSEKRNSQAQHIELICMQTYGHLIWRKWMTIWICFFGSTSLSLNGWKMGEKLYLIKKSVFYLTTIFISFAWFMRWLDQSAQHTCYITIPSVNFDENLLLWFKHQHTFE